MLRWAVYEAGKTHARASAPDHRYYAQVKDRQDGKRAALSEATPAWPAAPASRSRTHPMGPNRGQLLPVRCQPLPVLPRRARRTA